jgi:ElaB/YqjD/DUF883 family membrane-anchored ribosome-binding protein
MATTTTEAPSPATTDAGDDGKTAVQRLREQADAVVERIQPQIAAVSTYARNEPTKALLISAAAGAALMGLIALLVRSSTRSAVSSAGASAMAAIRDAALDLADSAQSMAEDALDATHKRASAAIDATRTRAASALGATQERAAAAADTVSESVADAWKKVREQAAPVIEKVKPQVEAATAYMKEDPARTALGLAAAGAIIAGLIAIARSAQDDSRL